MAHPTDRRYTVSHEWIRDEGDGTYTLGITDHAQGELGDLVFVELPEIDAAFAAGEVAVVVESVKAAADVYCPCQATVTAINEQLAEHPEHVNDDPHGAGWLYRFRPTDAFDFAALQDAAAYETAIA